MADEEENKEGQENEEEQEGAEDEDEGEEGGKKKKGGKLKWIIIAVVVAIAIAVPAILYLTGFFNKGAETATGEEGGRTATSTVNEDGVAEQTVYYDLEEFIVNLNVGSKRPSFLKMTVSLELPGESQIPHIEEKMPRIRDTFEVYLRELRQEDLQGSAGLYRLREELLLRINKIVYPSKVNDVLFKEILVQ